MRVSDVIAYDTRANQPAATTVPIGTLFCVSDEVGAVERSNGTTWNSVGGGGSPTYYDTRANQPAATTVPVGGLYFVSDEVGAAERSNGTTWDVIGQVVPRYRKVATILAADTPATDTVIDLITLPTGTHLEDVFYNVKTPWDSGQPLLAAVGFDLGGAIDGPVYLDNETPMPYNLGGPWGDLSYPNINAYITGLGGSPNSVLSLRSGMIGGTNSSTYDQFLPGLTLSASPLQVLYRESSGPATVGEVDIWVLAQYPGA